MNRLLAGLLFMFGFAIGASAQTTYAVVAQPFMCIDQTSFYCASYINGQFSGVPITINGESASMIIDLFANYGYGYVSFIGPVPDYFNTLEITKGPLNAQGFPTSLTIADKSGDLVLNLSVTWKAFSSGGGRGSHNVIWRPIISTDPAQPSYFVSAN